MEILNEIKKEKQLIAYQEKLLALEKLKKRRADTRNKIELGGLVIKSGMHSYNKAIVLGALAHALELVKQNDSHQSFFENIGVKLFDN